jgi:hypothetical protein
MLRSEDAAFLAEHDISYRCSAGTEGVDLVIENLLMPPGYSHSMVSLLVTLPAGFNDVGPDMFWMSPAVSRLGGGEPPGTGSLRQFEGGTWQRWSRHIGASWRPGIDNLATYLAYIRRCISLEVDAA